jgi:hypothetical protein
MSIVSRIDIEEITVAIAGEHLPDGASHTRRFGRSIPSSPAELDKVMR